MQFEEGAVAGAFLIRPQPRSDERGFFARVYCEKELTQQGLVGSISQVNTGFSPRRGTLRGMHYQSAPHAEVKIARCVRGAAFDVVVDLRPDSRTFKQWFGARLTADNGHMIYAPAGTAHGYLTLEADTELMYMTNQAYAPSAVAGVRFDDPAFGIVWPDEATLVSQADRDWADFRS